MSWNRVRSTPRPERYRKPSSAVRRKQVNSLLVSPTPLKTKQDIQLHFYVNRASCKERIIKTLCIIHLLLPPPIKTCNKYPKLQLKMKLGPTGKIEIARERERKQWRRHRDKGRRKETNTKVGKIVEIFAKIKIINDSFSFSLSCNKNFGKSL